MKTLSGKQLALEVEETTTVAELQAQIAGQEEVDIDSLMLLSGIFVLDDEEATLSEMGIMD